MKNRRYTTSDRNNRIEAIEITRETKKCYYTPACYGREDRCLKGHNYHATWEAAHAYLLKRESRAVQTAEESMMRHHAQLESVKGMRKPE